MRDEDEKLLLTLFLALLAAQMARVLRHVEWGLQDELPRDAVAGAMGAIASQQLFRVWMSHTSMPIPGSVWTRVSTWARHYSYELVKGIDAITRSQLAMYVQSYVTEGWTFGQLTEAIGTVFGPARAQRIAVTEVTRAYAQAAATYADEMTLLGLPTVLVWRIEDSDACDLCFPLDGNEQGDGWTEPPPAHPNCRCDVDAVSK